MRSISTGDNMVSISDLRRRFGEIEKALPYVDRFILTKKGFPFATLSATPAVKRKLMGKMAGAFKGTELARDGVWREVLKKKSRKVDINL